MFDAWQVFESESRAPFNIHVYGLAIYLFDFTMTTLNHNDDGTGKLIAVCVFMAFKMQRDFCLRYYWEGVDQSLTLQWTEDAREIVTYHRRVSMDIFAGLQYNIARVHAFTFLSVWRNSFLRMNEMWLAAVYITASSLPIHEIVSTTSPSRLALLCAILGFKLYSEDVDLEGPILSLCIAKVFGSLQSIKEDIPRVAEIWLTRRPYNQGLLGSFPNLAARDAQYFVDRWESLWS